MFEYHLQFATPRFNLNEYVKVFVFRKIFIELGFFFKEYTNTIENNYKQKRF